MGILQGKKIAVTGGGGFLGRAVCRELQNFLPESIFAPRSVDYDLRESSAVEAFFCDSKPDIVFHLAALVGGIGANREMPGRFFYDNAIMGLQLIEFARRYGIQKFISVSSICAYPKLTPAPFREDNLWDGYPDETSAPYGLAKKMLLVQSQAYRQQYGFNAITLLPVNLYGPEDNFDLNYGHVVPALIRKVIEARELNAPFVEVWGTGRASREFLFVRDASRGIVMAADRFDKPDPVNLGSGQEITIQELVEKICEICDFHGELRWNASRPDGQPRRCLDISRARNEFGFTAEMPLEAGLRETIQWFERDRMNQPLTETGDSRLMLDRKTS